MKLRVICVAAIYTGMSGLGIADAEELTISQEQLDNLGIVTGRPEPTAVARSFSAPARVRVPPEHDFALVPVHGGTIKRLMVAPGEMVKKGQVIAHMASPDFLSAQREFLAAVNNFELARNQHDRDVQLHSEGIVSDRRLAQSNNALDEAQTRADEMDHVLRLSGLTSANISQIKDSRQLNFDMAIRAPVTGTVLEQYCVAGQRMETTDPVYRIADLSRLWLEIDVPYESSLKIAVGSVIQIDHPGGTGEARVLHIGRHVNEENQTIVIRAVIEAGTDRLAPGQLVSASFTRAGTNELFELPASSIVRKGDSSYVFVRTSAGLDVREVEISGQTRGRAVVSRGLRSDETVVIKGTAALKAKWLGMGGGD